VWLRAIGPLWFVVSFVVPRFAGGSHAGNSAHKHGNSPPQIQKRRVVRGRPSVIHGSGFVLGLGPPSLSVVSGGRARCANGKGKMMGIEHAVSKSGRYPLSIFNFPRRGNAPETALISTAAFLRKAKKEGPSVDGLPFSYGLRFTPGPGLPSMSVVFGAFTAKGFVRDSSRVPSGRQCMLRLRLRLAMPPRGRRLLPQKA
jgi:hypothetical protein